MSTSIKSKELVTSQVKRIEKAKKGETVLLMFPIDLPNMEIEIETPKDGYILYNGINILELAPIQKGDKDIFIQEEFWIIDGVVFYESDYDMEIINSFSEDMNIQPSSEMTKEQSRYIISECIDNKAVRVNNITAEEKYKITKYEDDSYEDEDRLELEYHHFIEYYNDQLKEANINKTYKDNDYVFLVKIII